MRKFIALFLGVFVVAMATPAVAPAKAEAACGTSSTYLHLACAEEIASRLVNSSNCSGCSWRYTRDYTRYSSDRVDILAAFVRNGVLTCRWVITRGSDVSKYSYWHPNSSFNPGCGGV